MKQVNPNFLIEFISNLPSLARTGKLITEKNAYETPFCMLTTKGASIPHLSRELLQEYVLKDKLTNQVLQVSLSNTNNMEEALKASKAGISSFAGLKELSTFITFNDPCDPTPSGFNERDTAPLFTKRGKVLFTAEKYSDLISIMQPEIYVALCDSDTNNESSKKRLLKSLNRSENFLKNCIEKHTKSETLSKSIILAPIVGGYDKDTRSSCIKSIKNFDPSIGGYTFEGFHCNGSSASNIETNSLKDIVSHCIKEVNDEKIRFIQGAYNPLNVLELINLGIDVFDTSYVYLAAQNNKALCFDFYINEKDKNERFFYINLDDEKHSKEFKPFLDECDCLACKKHTRAYVHHLIKTRELLSSILLMIHNLHHYMKFFESIRKVIKNNELPKLIELVKNQMDTCDCAISDVIVEKSSKKAFTADKDV